MRLVKFNSVRYYVATFLMLYLSASCIVVNDLISSPVTIALWLLALAIIISLKPSINVRSLSIFIVIVFLFMVASFYNEGDFLTILKRLFGIIVAFFYANAIRFDEAKKIFYNLMIFIATFSLFFFVFFLLFPEMSLFPISVGKYTYYNLFFYVHEYGMARNCGFFWEPGAFQCFLNLALLIGVTQKQIDIRNVMILVFAIITTFSTSGYFAMIAIGVYYFLQTNKAGARVKFLLLVSLLGLGFILLGGASLFVSGENNLFGKIIHFFEENEFQYSAGTKLTSASVRYFSIIKPFEVFLQHPLLGVGYENLRTLTFEYTRGSISCTFVNWFAMYGLLFGVVATCGYLGNAFRQKKEFVSLMILIAILLIVVCSEDFSNNPFFYGLIIYGYERNRGVENEKQSVVFERV